MRMIGERLALVPSGYEGADLVDAERAKAVLSELLAYADIVVVATPPVQAGPAALAWTRAVDGTVLVARRDHARRQDVSAAAETLSHVGGRLIGAILAERPAALAGLLGRGRSGSAQTAAPFRSVPRSPPWRRPGRVGSARTGPHRPRWRRPWHRRWRRPWPRRWRPRPRRPCGRRSSARAPRSAGRIPSQWRRLSRSLRARLARGRRPRVRRRVASARADRRRRRTTRPTPPESPSVRLPAVMFWLGMTSVAYTYVGFPLIVLARARLRPRPAASAPIEPAVSIVMAAHNEAGGIAARLDNLLAAGLPARPVRGDRRLGRIHRRDRPDRRRAMPTGACASCRSSGSARRMP